MEMGTGKSRVAIELIHFYRQRGITRCTWICPVNTKRNVAREIEKHSSGLTVHEFNNKTAPKNADVYIVGTESISQSDRAYLEFVSLVDGSLIIVDESHDFKTPDAKRTRRLLQHAPRSTARYVMTGTPMTRGFEDLYCQMHFLSPQILGYRNFNHFAHYHLEFDQERKGQVANRKYADYVTTKIAPYVYQVKKEECLSLPEKTHSVSVFQLPYRHKALYSKVRDSIIFSPEFMESSSGVMVYKLFSALQRVVSGIYPLDDDERPGRIYNNVQKNPRIMDLLFNLDRIPDSAQVIIWAKYTTDIDDIQEVLSDRYGAEQVCVMHGGTSMASREEAIERFRNGARLFVSNPATGGTGLTLNEASYVIFYSQTFKYIERKQAEDRCHRIGQGKNVHYITIESDTKMDEMISNVLSRRGNAVEEFKKEVEAIKNMTDKKQAAKAIKKLRGRL